MTEWKNRKVARAWAIVDPSGNILLDSSFRDEARAWQVALGWPSDEEIKEAKKIGYIAVYAAVII